MKKAPLLFVAFILCAAFGIIKAGESPTADSATVIDSSPTFLDAAGGTNFVETWADLAQWTADGVQVQDGKLYAAPGSPNPSYANHSFPLGSTDEARIVCSFTVPEATTNGGGFAFIGVNAALPGSPPQVNSPNCYGIGIDFGVASGPGQYTAMLMNGRGEAPEMSGTIGPGVYTAVIFVDRKFVSFCLTYPGHANQVLQRFSRATIGNIGNIFAFNGDSRSTAGIAINGLAASRSFETANPREGIEGSGETMYRTMDDHNQNIMYWIPASYDSHTPIPLLIVAHGRGHNEMTPWVGQHDGGSPERRFYQQLVTNGCLIATSAMYGNNWGNSNGVRAISDLLDFTRRHFTISSVWLNGCSMGGLSSLTWIAEHKNEVTGYLGLYNVTSLRNMYRSATVFSNDIVSAYGLELNGFDYRVKTMGFDPSLQPGNRFGGVPMIFFYDVNDGTVNSASNTLAFHSLTKKFAPDPVLVPCPGGGHGGAAEYQADKVLSFMRSHRQK